MKKRRFWTRKQWCSGILLAFFLAAQTFVLSGCGNDPAATSQEESDNLVIATSFYPMYIMVLNVTQDIPGVEAVNVTGTVTGCLHDYQLTTNDLKKIHKAQILVVNGAHMESFLDQVIAQQPELKIVDASEGIELIEDNHHEKNAHIWVSISLAMEQVQNIADQLAATDPNNAQGYQSNAQNYIRKLEELKSEMHAQLDSLEDRNIVTFHEAFPYFAQEFGLNIVATVEREPGSEPVAAELKETIDIIRQSGVRAIFVEPQYSTKAAETIATETGAQVYTLDPAVTGPEEPEAYIEIMNRNLQVLLEALGS
ncbi:MAG: zinc ABC transporter substrate-binding protein [Syntrophomonadaceae bacterium]|nr:zinc ABC transporter substrate-binding protein [Syntrophomonadaceae bacterium]